MWEHFICCKLIKKRQEGIINSHLYDKYFQILTATVFSLIKTVKLKDPH